MLAKLKQMGCWSKKVESRRGAELVPPPVVKKFKEDEEQKSDSTDTSQIPDPPKTHKVWNDHTHVKFDDAGRHIPGFYGNPGVVLDPSVENILQRHFVTYLVGKPGSGKTYALEEMLLQNKYYCRRFNYIFIFSPYELPTVKCERGINWFQRLDVDVIDDIIHWV
jgi:hypothetical protein